MLNAKNGECPVGKKGAPLSMTTPEAARPVAPSELITTKQQRQQPFRWEIYPTEQISNLIKSPIIEGSAHRKVNQLIIEQDLLCSIASRPV